MNNMPILMPMYPIQDPYILNLENKINIIEKEICNLKKIINDLEKNKDNNNSYQTNTYNMM